MVTNNPTISALASVSTSSSVSGDTGKTFHFMLPTRENIIAGRRESVIVKIEPKFTDDDSGVLEHSDVFHELTDGNGNTDVYRFRYYPEYKGIEKWAKQMQKYGITGALSAVVGLREQVKVAFGERSDYAYIGDRKLIAQLPVQIPASTSIEVEDEVESVAEDEPEIPTDSATDTPPRRKPSGGLMSHRKSAQQAPTKRKSLLDDDDEFDDFLVYGEEDDEE